MVKTLAYGDYWDATRLMPKYIGNWSRNLNVCIRSVQLGVRHTGQNDCHTNRVFKFMSNNSSPSFFSRFATSIASVSGKPGSFVLAVTVVLVWAISGPFFGYSENWQLVINTGTTIVTFLMVFVLQNSQNRDGKALQAKLDELILTSQAQNKFVGIENSTSSSFVR
jgi:low affinity Fe/Cu permease